MRLVYWLRRIPAETRIVVLVVFLALFQAILLSVFGLDAIRRERQSVAETLAERAVDFLRKDVAVRVEAELRERAEESCRAAFDLRDPEWARHGHGLFTDAFLVRPDGRVEGAGEELPLWWPRELVDAAQQRLREASAGLRGEYRGLEFDEAEKAERNLAFALAHPFLADELGASLALLHAATPLFAGDGGPPDVTTLLRMRWVGEINRGAGSAAPGEVERFLARLDARGGEDPAYASGRAEQEARVRRIATLVLEKPSFRTVGQPALHRNARAGPEACFYVRPVPPQDDLQVLWVDPGRLTAFLDEFARSSRARAPEGVTPSLGPEGGVGPVEQVRLRTLPGYAATARVSDEAIRRQAADRERFYRYIIGFSVAGILAGGLLTARAVMREMKLAKLKAGFVSNVSHGLKTPLTSIRMFSEMLRNGQVKDDAERKECLDVIAQETERLGRLIQQVLDFGRLEARRRPFRWSVGPLEPIVRKEAERFRRATGIPEDQFRVRIAINLPPVTHDPEAFGEVIANLLSNAWKYTPPDRRRIELTLGPQRGRVVLSVEDNGPGIPPRERRRIFEQFYRCNDLLTREVEGTGLGLSIADGIVRAHGGRIFVEDGGGGGSRFLVVLPAAPRGAARGEAGS